MNGKNNAEAREVKGRPAQGGRAQRKGRIDTFLKTYAGGRGKQQWEKKGKHAISGGGWKIKGLSRQKNLSQKLRAESRPHRARERWGKRDSRRSVSTKMLSAGVHSGNRFFSAVKHVGIVVTGGGGGEYRKIWDASNFFRGSRYLGVGNVELVARVGPSPQTRQDRLGDGSGAVSHKSATGGK